MFISTLFTAHRPIEAYLRLDHPTAPNLTLRGLDSFVLHQLASFYPVPTTLVDLAADATGGASAIFAIAHRELFHSIHLPAGDGEKAVWRKTFADTLVILGHHVPSPDLNAPLNLNQMLSPLSPPLFLVAPGEQPTATVTATVKPLLDAHPRALVALVGGARHMAVGATLVDDGYNLTPVHELSPVFKASQLTIASQDTTTVDVLKRIAMLFDGNMNHVSMPEAIRDNNARIAEALSSLEEDNA